MTGKRRIVYAEPSDYFPKSVLEKYGLGEFCEKAKKEKLKSKKEKKGNK